MVAVNDGVITKIGKSKKLGRYIVLQDVYGNRYTYAQLGAVAEAYPVPKQRKLLGRRTSSSSRRADDPASPTRRPAPATQRRDAQAARASADATGRDAERPPARSTPRTRASGCSPTRSARTTLDRAGLTGQLDSLLGDEDARLRDRSRPTSPTSCSFDREDDGAASRCARARRSSPAPCSAGSARPTELAPHLHFAIRPAGRGAPRIDPKPILDGWKLLEATAIYRAAGKNPFADEQRERRPGPADVQGAARARGCSPTRASRSTPAAATTSAPARSTAACWRRSSTWPPAASGSRSPR